MLSRIEKAEIRAHWRPDLTAADVADLAARYQTSTRTVWRLTRDLRARSPSATRGPTPSTPPPWARTCSSGSWG